MKKLLITLFSICFTNHIYSEDINDFEIQANLIKKDSHILELTLNNNSDRVMIFQKQVLSRFNFKIIATPIPPYSQNLDGFSSLEYHLNSKINLLPGKNIKNSINLESSFPAILKAIKEKEVIIFWHTRVTEESSQKSKDFGGYIVLDKKFK